MSNPKSKSFLHPEFGLLCTLFLAGCFILLTLYGGIHDFILDRTFSNEGQLITGYVTDCFRFEGKIKETRINFHYNIAGQEYTFEQVLVSELCSSYSENSQDTV